MKLSTVNTIVRPQKQRIYGSLNSKDILFPVIL